MAIFNSGPLPSLKTVHLLIVVSGLTLASPSSVKLPLFCNLGRRRRRRRPGVQDRHNPVLHDNVPFLEFYQIGSRTRV